MKPVEGYKERTSKSKENNNNYLPKQEPPDIYHNKID